jgi:hypothetical protein
MGRGSLHVVEAFTEELRVAAVQADVVLRSASCIETGCAANYKCDSLGFRLADALRCAAAALVAMHHLVRLCCAQHKPTYVAMKFMWRCNPVDRSVAAFPLTMAT